MNMTGKGKVHTGVGKAFTDVLPVFNRERGEQIVFIFKMLNEIEMRKTDNGKAFRFGVGNLLERPLH